MAQRETLGKPEERPEETQWLPDGAAPTETAEVAEPLEPGDTSSWLASEVLEQAHEARPAEPDPDEEWDDVPGLPPRRDRIRPAPSDGDARAAAEPEPRSGRLDLNTATFEDLRNLGFSATQATRVLSYRDAHGLDSVERLKDISGLPDKLFESVKPSLTV